MLLETEECDSVNETSSVAIVNPPLYKQLVTDDNISVGEYLHDTVYIHCTFKFGVCV